MKPDPTPEGHCAACGHDTLTLARDMTVFIPYRKTEGGFWVDEGSSTEDMDNDDPTGNVRFFCDHCGEYHNIPEELT